MNIKINNLLKHQEEFVKDIDIRFLALVGGYGSGKTFSFCVKAIYLAWLNAGRVGCLLEPTNAMVADVIIPNMEEALERYGIPYDLKLSPYPTMYLHFEQGTTKLLLRSAENYRKLAGLNLAFFGVDELDTITPKKLARASWEMLKSRLRDKEAPYVQGYTTSTPEGFAFMYDFFVKEAQEAAEQGKKLNDRRIIHASTRDNPYLDPAYLESQLSTLPSNFVDAYIDGLFVPLTTGVVYTEFNRVANHSSVSLDDPVYDKSTIYIGMDFNVDKMSAVVHVTDNIGPIAVDEIIGLKNTNTMITAIKTKYPDRTIFVYPDSSGQNRDTASTDTDLKLLKSAGFRVKVRKSNPRVNDRIRTMNQMFCDGDGNRKYRVNTNKCPLYTDALEQQVYNEQGKPDKTSDTDHPNDAGGYYIHRMFNIKRNTKQHRISGVY